MVAAMRQSGLFIAGIDDAQFAVPIGGLVFVVVLGLWVLTTATGEWRNGYVEVTLGWVPNRERLILSRIVSMIILVGTLSILWLSVVELWALMTLVHGTTTPWQFIWVGVCTALAVTLAVLSAFCLGSAVPSGVATTALLMLVYMILPVLAAVAGWVWQGWSSSLMEIIASIMPGGLAIWAMTPGETEPWKVVVGLVGLALWCVTLAFWAWWRLDRRQ
jgi:hypothetical protein